jgi:hypothetical protein
MPTVQRVEAKGDKGAAILHLDDGSKVWTPEMDKAEPLIGKPIPEDWTRKQGEYGPQVFPPRPKKDGKGFSVAFRNTAEGQAAEQDSIHRSVALTQAVAVGGFGELAEWKNILPIADAFYTWLRATAGTAGKDRPSTTDEAAPREKGVRKEHGAVVDNRGQGSVHGEGAEPCSHIDTSPLKLDGNALPKGYLRCLACGTVHKEAA